MKKIELMFLLLLLSFVRCSMDEDLERLDSLQLSADPFFNYDGVDPGMKSLFTYLEDIDAKKPFIDRFQKRYGVPVWDYSQCISDDYSTGLYVPVYKKPEESVHVIWHFYFEEGQIKYRPVELDEIKRQGTDYEWMFDYFSQKVLGNRRGENVVYKPHLEKTSLLRGWQEVVTCVDAFVNDVFKGTHCWTSSMEWVAEDNPAPIEHTIPGSDAGDYIGQIPTYATFTEYPHLRTIYGMNSTLTHGQKMILESAMSEFSDFSSFFNLILSWFNQEGIKIDFNINAHVIALPSGERDTVVAAFVKNTQAIDFKNEDQIRFKVLGEELIHAFQYYRFYQDVMNPNDKDYEFEAKVCMDLAAVCDEDSFSEPIGYLFHLYPDCADLVDDYWDWLEQIESQKGLFNGDLDTYYELGRRWNHPNYRGTFKGIEAKMIKQMFRKK